MTDGCEDQIENLEQDPEKEKIERIVTINTAIVSFFIPIAGFIFTCMYWKTNRKRSYICLGLALVHLVIGIIVIIYVIKYVQKILNCHGDCNY